MSLFESHDAMTLADVSPFSEWLQDCLRKDYTLSVVPRERTKRVCFASRDDSWELDFKNPAGPLVAGVLKTQFLALGNLKLTARDISRDLPELVRILAAQWGVQPQTVHRAIAANFVGDLTAAAHCINQSVTPHSKFKRLDQDAFEVALLLPQYEHDICRYYKAVGIPKAKLHAEVEVQAFKVVKPEWYVTYRWLWLRVLAYYTGDPTLGYALTDNLDPLDAVGRVLKVSPQEAEVAMLWQACGRDIETFKQRFADRMRDLPSDINEWNGRIDRAMPAMSSACASMVRSYIETRQIETRFGRRLRPGAPLGEAVAFRVFGTTEELVANCAATICNNRPSQDIMIVDFQGGPAAEVVRLAGIGPKGDILGWLREVRELATLGAPLGAMPLSPATFQA